MANFAKVHHCYDKLCFFTKDKLTVNSLILYVLSVVPIKGILSDITLVESLMLLHICTSNFMHSKDNQHLYLAVWMIFLLCLTNCCLYSFILIP